MRIDSLLEKLKPPAAPGIDMMKRKELKYLINIRAADELIRLLSRCMEPDPYGDETGCYEVSTLYFDTPFRNGEEDIRAGIGRRSRFRLRKYNDDDGTTRLEQRIRQGDSVCKRRSFAGSAMLNTSADGQPRMVFHADDPIQCLFYSFTQSRRIRPASTIRYTRTAFRLSENSARITIDQNVRVSPGTESFLMPSTSNGPCLPNGTAILEIKVSSRIPALLTACVRSLHAQRSSMSKYLLGMENLNRKRLELWTESIQYQML